MNAVIAIFFLLLIISVIARIIHVSLVKGVKKLNEVIPPKIEAMVLLVTEEAVVKKLEDGEYVPDARKTIEKYFHKEVNQTWLNEWIKAPTIVSIQPHFMIEKLIISYTIRDELKANGIASQISESSQLFSVIRYGMVNDPESGIRKEQCIARLVIVGQLISTGSFHLMYEDL